MPSWSTDNAAFMALIPRLEELEGAARTLIFDTVLDMSSAHAVLYARMETALRQMFVWLVRALPSPVQQQQLRLVIVILHLLPALLFGPSREPSRNECFRRVQALNLSALLTHRLAAARARMPAAREPSSVSQQRERAGRLARRRGGLRKASQELSSTVGAAPYNPTTFAALEAMHPHEDAADILAAAEAARGVAQAKLAAEGGAIRAKPRADRKAALRGVIMKAPAMSQAGPDGRRFDHVQVAVRTSVGDDLLDQFVEVQELITSAEYAGRMPRLYFDLLTVSSLAAFGTTKLRPVAVGTVDCRIQTSAALKLVDITEKFTAVGQHAVGEACGTEHLAERVRAWHDSHWVLQLDAKNAFNRVSRARTFEGLAEVTPPLVQLYSHLYDHAALLLFPLEGGPGIIYSRSGARQGCGLASLGFCAATYLPMRQIALAAEEEGTANCEAYVDDAYCALAPDLVADADRLQQRFATYRDLFATVRYELQPTKCKFLPPKGHVVTQAERDAVAATGCMIAEQGGMEVVGCPVGTDEYIIGYLQQRLAADGPGQGYIQLAGHIAGMSDTWAAMQLLSHCLPTRLMHLARSIDPTLLIAYLARQVDTISVWALESIMRLPGTAAPADMLPAPDAHKLTLTTAQQLQAFSPLSTGGLGIVSLEHIAAPAFLASKSVTIPPLAGPTAPPWGAVLDAVQATLPTGQSATGIQRAAAMLIRQGVQADKLPPLISAGWTEVGRTAATANAMAAEAGMPDPPLPPLPLGALTPHGADQSPRRLQAKLSGLFQDQLLRRRTALAQTQPDIAAANAAGVESCRAAAARMRSQQGPGAMAFVRHAPVSLRPRQRADQPFDAVDAMLYALSLRRSLGLCTVYLELPCPACGKDRADSVHALACGRTGHQIIPHDAVNRELLCILEEEVSVHGGERECTTCFSGPRKDEAAWRMDTFVPLRAIHAAPDPDIRKQQLLDVTVVNGCAASLITSLHTDTVTGAAAAHGETSKAHHYADTYVTAIANLVCIAVENHGRLGTQALHFLDQIVEHKIIVAAQSGVSVHKGGLVARIRARIAATLQAALSLREMRYLQHLRDRRLPAELDLEALWEPGAWQAG